MPNVRNNSAAKNKSLKEIVKSLLLGMSPKMTLIALLVIALMFFTTVGWVLIKQPKVAAIILGRDESSTPTKELPRAPEPAKSETAPPAAKATSTAPRMPRPNAGTATGNATVTGDNNTVINNSTVTDGVQK
jgi:hypothetical protein